MALGAAMEVQALACAYYAVFVALVIGLSVFLTAAWKRLGTDKQYWQAIDRRRRGDMSR